jgi:hypothetical protein
MKWISVKDKFPEEDVLVIVFSPTSQDTIQTGKYRGHMDYYIVDDHVVDEVISLPSWDDNSCCHGRIKNVTHWMELPESPQE